MKELEIKDFQNHNLFKQYDFIFDEIINMANDDLDLDQLFKKKQIGQIEISKSPVKTEQKATPNPLGFQPSNKLGKK